MRAQPTSSLANRRLFPHLCDCRLLPPSRLSPCPLQAPAYLGTPTQLISTLLFVMTTEADDLIIVPVLMTLRFTTC
jgi:hypothetical protein